MPALPNERPDGLNIDTNDTAFNGEAVLDDDLDGIDDNHDDLDNLDDGYETEDCDCAPDLAEL